LDKRRNLDTPRTRCPARHRLARWASGGLASGVPQDFHRYL